MHTKLNVRQYSDLNHFISVKVKENKKNRVKFDSHQLNLYKYKSVLKDHYNHSYKSVIC